MELDNQQVTAFEFGWLIGAIDGEGCVGISRRNRHNCTLGFSLKPHIQIANCDQTFINRCTNILAKLQIPFWVSHYETKGRRNESWQIVISGLKRVIKLLPLIKDHLCDDKKIKANLTLQFCKSRLSKWQSSPFTNDELILYRDIVKLNIKGTKALNLRDYTRNPNSKLIFGEDIVQTTTE